MNLQQKTNLTLAAFKQKHCCPFTSLVSVHANIKKIFGDFNRQIIASDYYFITDTELKYLKTNWLLKKVFI